MPVRVKLSKHLIYYGPRSDSQYDNLTTPYPPPGDTLSRF